MKRPGWWEALLGDLAEERASRRAAGESPVAAWLAWAMELARSAPSLIRHGLWARPSGTRMRRDQRKGDGWMRTWFQDVRYGARSLSRTPALTATIVLTLAMGIGAGTAVFTLVDNLVLNPFSYPEIDRLVGVGPVYPKLDRDVGFWEVLSPAEFEDIREQSETLERVVAWDMGNRSVTVGDATENLFSAFWWGDPFPTLGVEPALGRGFTEDEVRSGAPVAIVSHRVWSNRLGSDSALIGGPILVNGNAHTLVGVMPAGTLIYGTDLWLPMGVSPSVFARDRRQFQLLARLAPGVEMEAARVELAAIADRTEAELASEYPEYEGWTLVPMTWKDINVRQLKPAALALLGAIAFVLLLVCANVASMLMARSATREREMAVRSALGAGRGRILRQLLTESVMLAGLAGGVGVGIAYLAVAGVAGALATLGVPIPGELGLNTRVLGFTTLVAVVTGVLFGLAPALYSARRDVRFMLSGGGQGTSRAGRLRMQRLFVGVEVAMAIILLVGGALLVNSFVRLQAVEPGFDTRDMLTMRLTLAWERYDRSEMEPFLRELTRRLDEEPSIVAAATATQFPPLAFSQNRFVIEGAEVGDESTLPTAFTTITSPDYFQVMGVPVLRGRTLNERDRSDGRLVVVLNEAAAERYFAGRDPIGQRIRIGGPDSSDPWFEVVGVVGSTRNRGLDAPAAPEMFASIRQLPSTSNQHFLLLRTRGDARAVLPVVKEVVAAMDPRQPVYQIRTVEEAFSAVSAQRRMATTTLAIFGLFALVLAGVGIYAVVSFSVAQRTREIGVRMALGAGRGSVRGLVVRQALVPVVVGAAVGLAGAVAAGRALSSLLYDVGSADPATFIAVVALFGAIATLASYMPARRASALDPVAALREDSP